MNPQINYLQRYVPHLHDVVKNKHPQLYEKFHPWNQFIISKIDSIENTFSQRMAFLIVLRTTWHCKNSSIFNNIVHTCKDRNVFKIGEVEAICSYKYVLDKGVNSYKNFFAEFKFLLNAIDELTWIHIITDETWKAFVDGNWSVQHIFDVIFTVGHVLLLSMVSNSIESFYPNDNNHTNKENFYEALRSKIIINNNNKSTTTSPSLLSSLASLRVLPLKYGSLPAPRISALEDESEWTDLLKRMKVARGRVPQIHKYIARHNELHEAWMVFAAHVATASATNSLTSSDKEIPIIRVGVLCQSPYEYNAHIQLGAKVGLSNEMLNSPEFKLLYNDEDTDGEDNVVKEYEWSDKHRCMIQGTDELISNFSLTQDTLKKLYTNFTNEVSKDDADKQLIDYVFAIGQYFLTCLALNSIGCQTLQNVDMKSENSDWTSRM